MSEEEKTLIFAKHYIKDNEDVFEFPKKELEILVNLIEKQNNRLEQLEKENKSLVAQYEYQGAIMVNEYMSLETIKELFIPKSVIREKIEEYKKYGLKRNIGSFIDMSTYKAITYEEALDELKEELLGE